MAAFIVLDEFHLTISAPANLPEAEYETMHRSLNSRRLYARITAAVRHILYRSPALLKVRIRLSR